MFWMNCMGPRGPMNGHRGFDRGFGPRVRRPMGFHRGFGLRGFGLGLGGLFLLPALLFGGWMIVAVVFGVIGVLITILGSVITGLASIASEVFSGISSVGSIAVGILIGLALFSRIKKNRNARAAYEEKTTSEESVTGQKTASEEWVDEYRAAERRTF